MKIPTLLLLSMAFLVCASSAFSQEETPDGGQPGIKGFWEVIVSGGRFVVRLDHISSVSQHEYLIDGTVRVFECTIDTNGGQTGRFYYLEPVTDSAAVLSGSETINRLKDLANKVTTKAGVGDINTVVTKNYPTTTHSKTSEYRVQNKETIGQIYDHARRVWAEEKGKGGENQLVIRNG